MPEDWLAQPRSFTAGSLIKFLDPWYETASAMDRFHVNDVLLDVAGGQWVQRREWVPDTHRAFDYHILARTNLVVTIRLAMEYPGYVQLARIGPFGSG